MLVARIDLQLFEKLTSKSVLGQHALDGKTDKVLRPFLQKFLSSNGLKAPDVTAVPVVIFLFPFSARQDNLIRINNYNSVTGIDMGSKKRIVFSSQTCSYSAGKPPKNRTVGINNILDKEPPLWPELADEFDVNTYATYEPLGRYIFTSMRFDF